MKLTAECFGDGPELVMLPGWSMPAAVLRPWAQRLASQWRVRLLELPGHGRCTRRWPSLPALIDVLAEISPAEGLWLGWSLGGELLVAAAAQRRPRGLFLLATTPRFCAADEWPGIEPDALRAMQEGLAQAPEKVVAAFRALLARRGQGARTALRALREQLAANCPATDPLAGGLSALAELDLRAGLPELTPQARWVCGDQDPLVDAQAVRWAAGQMPAGRSAILAGAGHLPFLTHAAAVDAELAAMREELFGSA